jgi:hypothetical protein
MLKEGDKVRFNLNTMYSNEPYEVTGTVTYIGFGPGRILKGTPKMALVKCDDRLESTAWLYAEADSDKRIA